MVKRIKNIYAVEINTLYYLKNEKAAKRDIVQKLYVLLSKIKIKQ